MVKEKLLGRSSVLSKLSRDLDNMPLFAEFDKDDIDTELLQLSSQLNLGDDGLEPEDEPENADEDDDSSGNSDAV
jgi:hypothetical protein